MGKLMKLCALLVVVLLEVVGCSGGTNGAAPSADQSFIEATELLIVGEPTRFNSTPKRKAQIGDFHPRLMFNKTEVESIREKLGGPEYADERKYLATKKAASKYGGPSIQAFRWQVFGDKTARDQAITRLLSGDIAKWGFPLHDVQWMFAWATTYDWLSDSLTQQQREVAWKRVKNKMGGNIAGYKKKTNAKPFEFNHNDSWGRTPRPYEAAVAIAIHGDGVDDALAEFILGQIASGHESFLSPHAMLDWLNLMALDTGGSQASHDTDNVTGYAGMYAFPCMLYHGYWESATGENLWSRSNFFRFFPLWNVYDNDAPLRNNGLAIMEVVAGRYRNSDPDMAALAAWYLAQFGRNEISNCLLLPRLIWGDKRVKPKSPEELGLPLAKHLRGADCFVSRSSWADDATIVNVATRTLDHLRYEPSPGVISIYRAGKPILVDSRKGKWRRRPVSSSGVKLGSGVGSMYWKPPHQWRKRIGRPGKATQVASNSAYYPACVQDQQNNEFYHSVTVKYDHLSLEPEAKRAYRTVVHLHRLPEFVVVIDQWDVSPETGTLINWRLATLPNVTNNTFSWSGASATVLDANGGKLRWVGGVGHELERLNGSWAGDNKSGYKRGYSKSVARSERMGLGNVYLAGTGANQCVTVIAIGESKPPQVTKQGNTLSFGGYQLVTKTDARFELSHDEERPKP